MSPLLVTQGLASNVSLLISLPLDPTSGPRASWERGLEILPGALQAVNDINNDSTVLSGCNLQLIIKDDTEIVQNFIDLAFHQKDMNFVGVSGMIDPKALSILLPLVTQTGILLSAITHKDMPEISDYSSCAILSLPPPSSVVDVLLSFMRIMNWQRIGLVTDSFHTDTYFFSVAEALLQRAKTDSITVSQYTELFQVQSGVREIMRLKTRIIFVSVDPRRVMQLLCVLHDHEELLWPHYAWIFHSFSIKDLLEEQPACNITNTIEGVFLIDSRPNLKSDPLQGKLNTFSSNYCQLQYLSSMSDSVAFECNSTLRPQVNSYAALLYGLIWSTAIALNESHNRSTLWQTESMQSPVRQVLGSCQKCDMWIFSISHVRELQPVLISTMYYSNFSTKVASFNASTLDGAPKDKLPLVTVHPPFVYTVLTSLLIAFTAIFVTVALVLYIYFYKEPEVKATSFTLSLLVFVGCYLNLLYLSLLLYNNHVLHSIDIPRDNALCLGLQWLSATGISLPLMLATLLVKMLRIYHIFYSTKMRRVGPHCSDLSLAVYVVLLLIPGILLNLIWALVDRYQVYFEYKMQNGYIYLEKHCRSKNQVLLYGVATIYLLILVFALAVVAVITRKVRLQDFKDTKKVNILVFSFCVAIVVSVSYWLLLQALNTKRYIANIPLIIGHLFAVVLYMSLLFVPKVIPPLWRNTKLRLRMSY